MLALMAGRNVKETAALVDRGEVRYSVSIRYVLVNTLHSGLSIHGHPSPFVALKSVPIG